MKAQIKWSGKLCRRRLTGRIPRDTCLEKIPAVSQIFKDLIILVTRSERWEVLLRVCMRSLWRRLCIKMTSFVSITKMKMWTCQWRDCTIRRESWSIKPMIRVISRSRKSFRREMWFTRRRTICFTRGWMLILIKNSGGFLWILRYMPIRERHWLSTRKASGCSICMKAKKSWKKR